MWLHFIFHLHIFFIGGLSRRSDTEYHPSGNSNLSFHVRADLLNVLPLYDIFMFFHV